MRSTDIKNALQTFQKTIDELEIDITNDSAWPTIANELLKGKDEIFQLSFWLNLEKYFLDKEKSIGACHKGHVYWFLSLLHLQKGDITACIDYLEKSVSEDKMRNPTQFSASIGLVSVLKPLLFRYKDGKAWSHDKEIYEYYQSLDEQEKRDFANELFTVHDMTVGGSMWVIKDDFFGFISDEKNREIIHDTYTEVRDTILNLPLKTYYSCIFAIGSILEAMLDDLFSRDKERVWDSFHKDSVIQRGVQKGTKMGSLKYDSGMTLGQKIRVLFLMAKHGKLPMSKQTVLLMVIMGEYRDLIHPRRRLGFEHQTNRYVATFLFTLISRVAGNWWQENIDKYFSTS